MTGSSKVVAPQRYANVPQPAINYTTGFGGPDTVFDQSNAQPAKVAKGNKRKRSPEPEVDDTCGKIVTKWRVKDPQLSAPWVLPDLAASATSYVRLHKEIQQFYDFVRPREWEDEIRHDLVRRVQRFLDQDPKCAGYHAEVGYFGSFAAGIYLPDADMDLVVRSREFRNGGYPEIGQNRGFLHQFGKSLARAKLAKDGSVIVIAGARVPLVKYTDALTNLKVDVSFENNTGLAANQTYVAWKQQYPYLPIIVSLVKQFLHMRNLNDVSTGGLGGFSVTCLVVSLFQFHPQVQSNSLGPAYFGALLVEFFNFYGKHFHYHDVLIELNPPRYSSKVGAISHRLSSHIH